MATEITTNNQHLTLTQQITAVTEKLVPASESAIAARILMMERAGMKLPANVDNAGKAYAFALANVPLQALKTVSERLVQGKIDRKSQGFIPVPSELAALVRAEVMPLVDHLAHLRGVQDALSYRPPERPSEDAIARVRRMRQEVMDRAEALRIEERGPEKSDAELNYLFRNKLPPPLPGPSDGEYFKAQQQQEVIENGKESFSDQDQGDGFVSGGSEGREDDFGGV